MQKRQKNKQNAEIWEFRLGEYYGPPLPEQPLPLLSWRELRARLGPQGHEPQSRWSRFWHRLTRQRRDELPPSIWDVFQGIAHDARRVGSVYIAPPAVAVQRTRRLRAMPLVRVSLWRGGIVKLSLPSPRDRSLAQEELHVLLASGLARYQFSRQPAYRALRLLIISAFLLLEAGNLALLWIGHPISLITWLLSALLLLLPTLLTLWLCNLQARAMLRRADASIVTWIGREQVCRGLHALASRTSAPSQRRWGDLSLSERIERICGSQVMEEQEPMSLVR